jgi:hypothetical protein
VSGQFTTDWLNSYEARHAIKQPKPSSGVDRESKLHDDILDECQRRGWLAVHGRMDVRSTITKGAPDFIILTERGVLLIECKTKEGKLSTDQMAFHAWARRLGHTVHVVRSMDEFRAIL